MYDKLFCALEENDLRSGDQYQQQTPKGLSRVDSHSLHHSSSKELGSTSGSLFGAQAVDTMQRKYAEQIQARVDELEGKVKEKEEQNHQLLEKLAAL